MARRNKRRTILPEDIVEALEDNDFGSFAGKVMPVVESKCRESGVMLGSS